MFCKSFLIYILEFQQTRITALEDDINPSDAEGIEELKDIKKFQGCLFLCQQVLVS